METIKANIFSIKEGVIGHQVNCLGKMGKGIALQFKQRYPRTFVKYRELCQHHKYNKLALFGMVQPVWADNSKKLLVLHLFGQFATSEEHRTTNYDALASIARKLRDKQQKGDLGDIYLPHGMGCRLGGGNWKIVSKLFEVVDGYWCKL